MSEKPVGEHGVTIRRGTGRVNLKQQFRGTQTIKIEVFEKQKEKIHFMFLMVSYRHFLML